ncbi:MAG: serine hydrolase [Ferruginibacter sp.]
MKKIFFLPLLLFFFLSNAQKTDVKLQKKITELIQGFHGDIGIYVNDLKHNKIVSINADSIFPTASIVKVPILLGIMTKIEKGELNYHQTLTYTDSLYYNEGDDILSKFKDSSTIELSKVIMLMLTISDNTASLWLQGLAGGGKKINTLLDSL